MMKKTKKTKGIILAGGSGSRLYPLSKIYSKQLVAVFDKPMIYYSISTLISAGISEILIISDEIMLKYYKKIFDNGKKLGLKISYEVQEKPNGIAEAFIIGKKFIGGDNNVALILGDNIFYGTDNIFQTAIKKANSTEYFHGIIFALYVNEPQRYGVVKFYENKNPETNATNEIIPIEIIEKPKNYISNYAVPGFYIYNSTVVEVAENLKPSKRGELEITDVNNYFLKNHKLEVLKLQNGVTWLDCGTPLSLLNASNFIASIEERHGIKLGCYEEESYKMKFISQDELLNYCKELPDCDYKNYLLKRIKISNR